MTVETAAAAVVTAVLLLACFAPDRTAALAAAANTATPFALAAVSSPVDGYSSASGYDDDGDGDDEYVDGDDPQSREHRDQSDQDDPVSTVTVSAVRGSIAFLPCDIGGGNNDGLPPQPPNTESTSGTKKSKDSANAIEDRAYMVLWFKHQQNLMIRHRNSKPKNKKNPSSGGKPLYSFDVRGRPLNHALKWSSDENIGGFGPRASFIVFNERMRSNQRISDVGNDGLYDNSSKAALRVINVTEQDAGSYRCRVDFRDSPTRNYRIILQVIVPPDAISISYNGGNETKGGRHHVIGPVPEGSRLVLLCKVHGGKPKPRMQWYSANGKVPLSSRTDFAEEKSFDDGKDDETTMEKLVINKLDRSHANSTYTCLAGNDNNIESNLHMTVLINMYLNVRNVRIVDVRLADVTGNTDYNKNADNNGIVQGQNLISGKWYTAECWAEGASPRATIEWSIDGNGSLAEENPTQTQTTRILTIEQTDRSSRIRLRPTPNDDGRYLRCQAWNPEINTTRDNIKYEALLLNVQYPPIVKLSLGHTFDPSRIKTGDDVYFECKVLDGGGKGKQHNRIEWYHNGHPILQNGSSNSSIGLNLDIKVVLLSAGTLVIRNVGRRHSGQYTCQCSNDLGTGRSRPVNLHIQYAPVCADDSGQQLVGVEKNEDTVHVTCRVRADPDRQVQFEWLVWPGANSAEMHQQEAPGAVATGNYVTTAVPSANDTGLVVGRLALSVTAVSVPDVYVDRTPNVKKPVALNTVSCRATNSVGRQQFPCLYYIIPASAPGALTGCVIKLPEEQDEHSANASNRQHRRTAHNRGEDKDVATVSCILGNDGGVRPVFYSLEIYESNALTTTFISTTEDSAEIHRSKYHGEWLIGNFTGTAAGGNTINYQVNRKDLQLRIGYNENRKYLSLSVYASNRMGRGLQAHVGSENEILLRHPWWWFGRSEETSTKTTVSGTSSTEWWIMLSGGNGDNDQQGYADGGQGAATTNIVVILAGTIAIVIVVALVLLWKWRNGGRQSSAETRIAANLITAAGNAECGEKANKKYSLLSQQQNFYPNLNLDDVTAAEAPDIMIRQNSYGKPCLVSIANTGIPGPESCV